MLKLIQLFTSAWRNKNTEKKVKKKIRKAVVSTTFTKQKNKNKIIKNKTSHTNIYKIKTNVRWQPNSYMSPR